MDPLLYISLHQGGSGFVRKINFWNVWMSNVSNPIIIDQYYCDSPFQCPNQVSKLLPSDPIQSYVTKIIILSDNYVYH